MTLVKLWSMVNHDNPINATDIITKNSVSTKPKVHPGL